MDRDYGRWDYIILGAGSAGCVLANRLSADPASFLILSPGLCATFDGGRSEVGRKMGEFRRGMPQCQSLGISNQSVRHTCMLCFVTKNFLKIKMETKGKRRLFYNFLRSICKN